MAKLLKLRRGTTSQHGSFTGAEGEVTIDTDKETAVVHDGSTAGGHALAKETMTNVSSASIAGRFADDAINPTKIAGGTLGTDVKVADGNINGNLTIENADVTNTAAIAGTKITPAFGSQNLSTSGTAATGALTVTGNIGVSGTVDGRDVASDGSKLDGIEASATADQTAAEIKTLVGSASDSNVFTDADHAKLDALTTSNGVILNGVTATTQSAGDASTKVATTAYTDTAITNLVDSSPSALNTLNELAAAIGDDANFSTTITNSIAGKLATNGNGASVTNLNASALASGTIPDARFPSTLPAVSGANLTGIVSFVSGMIIIWSGSTGSIPSGWVLCNGSNSTPDLRDRFIVGAGNSYAVDATGGASTVTLTTAQLAAHGHTTDNHTHSFDAGNHTHSFSGSGSSDHSHSFNWQYGAPPYHSTANMATKGSHKATNTLGNSNTGNATVSLSVSGNTGNGAVSGNTGSTSITTNNTGSGSSHENRPPYYALCYIMKT
jgi:microcystin-dependent protein